MLKVPGFTQRNSEVCWRFGQVSVEVRVLAPEPENLEERTLPACLANFGFIPKLLLLGVFLKSIRLAASGQGQSVIENPQTARIGKPSRTSMLKGKSI